MLAPFPAHEKQINLLMKDGSVLTCSLMDGFKAVAEGALLYEHEGQVLSHAAKLLLGITPSGDFDQTSVMTLRRELLLYGLIEIAREDRSKPHYSKGTMTQTVTIWKLTDYGRRQLAAVAP